MEIIEEQINQPQEMENPKSVKIGDTDTEGVGKSNNQYVDFFKQEYSLYKSREIDLKKILIKVDAKTLEGELPCPAELLAKQQQLLANLSYIMEVRAEYEKIKL